VKKILLVFLIAFVATFSFTSESKATSIDGKMYGIGFQMLDPELIGVGILYDIKTRPVTLQPIIGLDPMPSFGFRMKYAFARKKFLDAYASGMVGYADRLIGGAGIGVEWDWRMVEKTLPPLSWSIEVGMNGPEFGVGFGVHYTF